MHQAPIIESKVPLEGSWRFLFLDLYPDRVMPDVLKRNTAFNMYLEKNFKTKENVICQICILFLKYFR